MRLSECFNTPQPIADSFKCLFYGFFILVNINYDLLILLSGVIIIDMGLGTLKAIRLKDKLSFSVFIFGFVTKLAMLIIPFTIAVFGIALGYEGKVFADMAIRLLMANECLSILANFISIKNKKRVENIDLLTLTLDLIRKHTETLIRKIIGGFFGTIPINNDPDKNQENKND